MKAVFIECNTERFVSEEITEHINSKLKGLEVITSTSCVKNNWVFITAFCKDDIRKDTK